MEDWTPIWRRKELVAECKALGLSDYGVRADLVARIKEARAAAQSDNERPRRPRRPRRQSALGCHLKGKIFFCNLAT